MTSALAKRPSLPGLFLYVLGAGLPVSIIGALVIGFDLAPGAVGYAAPAVAGPGRGGLGFPLAGVVVTVALLLLGYVVCWAGWWPGRGR